MMAWQGLLTRKRRALFRFNSRGAASSGSFSRRGRKNLKADGKIGRNIDPQVAGMVYQGIVRETLYAKCISKDKRYRNIELDEIVDQAMNLFFRAIGVSSNE